MVHPAKVLVVDAGSGYQLELDRILKSATGLPPAEITVRDCRPGSRVVEPSADNRFDLIFLMARELGPATDAMLRGEWPLTECPVMVIADSVSHLQVIKLLKQGVTEVIAPPPTASAILPKVWRILQHRFDPVGEQLKQKLGLARLLGQAPGFLAELNKIPLAAKFDVSVLLTGETGTGKELFARAIHYLSLRSHAPFNPVNCGALPTELVENELFGHAPGAFTGANGRRRGLIAESEGGTLFLDEIDCLSATAQVKLLRFLQEGEYRPLGSTRTQTANVRVICATNSSPELAIRSGRLRQDFYYRINVFPISLPSLRERRQDIPLLARHFLAKYSTAFNKSANDFSPAAIEILTRYDWPGNVRELEHVIERAVILCTSPRIEREEITLPDAALTADESFREAKARMVSQFERNYLLELLSMHHGNISHAARAVNKNRRALFALLKKYEIRVEQFRDRLSA